MNGNSKQATEKQRLVQEKCQAILNGMLKDEDNKYCVDCDAKGPRWASWNLGVFLCIRCAGIHRNLGVHISKVKSVNLDTWKPEQAVALQQMGNSRARAVYEANLPDNFRRPQTDSSLEAFIRAKYEQNKYTAREWVPPRPPKVNWDAEIDAMMKESKHRKTGRGRVEGPAPLLTKPLPAPGAASSSALASATAAAAKAKEAKSKEAPAAQPTSAATDLLGLDSPSPGPAGSPAAAAAGSVDPFGDFLAAGPATAAPAAPAAAAAPAGDSQLQAEEASFFGQASAQPAAAASKPMTRDSILALYGQSAGAGAGPGGGGLAGFASLPAVSAPMGFPPQQPPQQVGYPAGQGFSMGYPAVQQLQQLPPQPQQLQSHMGAFQSAPYQQPYMAGPAYGMGMTSTAPASMPPQAHPQLHQQMAGLSMGHQPMPVMAPGAVPSAYPPMGGASSLTGPLWQ